MRSCEKISLKGQHPKAVGFSANKVGRKVFTFGGLVSGQPTNHLFMFSLGKILLFIKIIFNRKNESYVT